MQFLFKKINLVYLDFLTLKHCNCWDILLLMLNQKAFSLIEILTAVLLLAGLIAIVVQISYGSNRRMKKTRQLEKMYQLLENKMLDLKGEYQGSSIVNLPENGEGEFEQDSNYTWSYETQAIQLPTQDVILSLIQLPDNQLNNRLVGIFKSILSDTIVELKLTVSYNPPRGKSMQYSISSYFINYEEAPYFIFNQMTQIFSQGSAL